MNMPIAKTAMLIAGLIPALAFAYQWSYERDNSPENWGELNSEFKDCQQGKNQSPIDINNALTAHISPLELHTPTALPAFLTMAIPSKPALRVMMPTR